MTNKNTELNSDQHRVLSVSYGCFSIQLQGFEDPFIIMKRVTEYFRIVSLDNPSFGAKPLFEDTSILQHLGETAFGNDIAIQNDGETLTLTPADAVVEPTPVEEVETPESNEVFVLEETPMVMDGTMDDSIEIEAPAEIVETAPEAIFEEEPAQEDSTEGAAHLASSLEAAIANALQKPEQSTPVATKQPNTDAQPSDDALRSLVAAVSRANQAATAADEIADDVASEPFEAPEEVAELPTLELLADPAEEAPKQERKFRIIRNDYAYDEAPATEPEIELTPKTLSVNPFRKFPIKTEALSTQTMPTLETPEEAQKDEPASSYRKLRI